MMEVTPHLKTVLKNYQHSATKSLQGPGLALIPKPSEEVKDDVEFIQPQPFPIQQLPILISPDKTCSERTETILEGEPISCFVVGGEKRLCLPQVLKSVLAKFKLPEINQECDILQIYCSRCTPEQLNVLKSQGIIPSSAPSVGLITKTDAERLCSALLHGREDTQTLRPRKGALTFMVYHECFGLCRGVCVPEMYTEKTARCIECLDCHGWFSPQHFVCHAHRELENRTVHWGFDSCNWRAYLLVAEDQIDQEQYGKCLDELKERHDGKIPFPRHEWNNPKRKLVPHETEMVIKQEVVDIPIKKNKMEDYFPMNYNNFQQLYGTIDPMYLTCLPEFNLTPHMPISAFKPFGPSFKETMLRQSIALSNSRYVEQSVQESYQPNVALTPATPKKHRYIKPAEKEVAPVNEVTSSKEERRTPVIKIEKADVEQKSPDSQNLIDSTVSVVQSTVNLPRYNSEIELSTDTDDTASVSSEKAAGNVSEISKIEEVLKNVDVDTREAVLRFVKGFVKEHENALLESKVKDNKIRELEAKVEELERRVCDNTHNTEDTGGSPMGRLTPAPPTPPTEPSESDQKKSVIATLDCEAIKATSEAPE